MPNAPNHMEMMRTKRWDAYRARLAQSPPIKVCSKCKRQLPLTAFYPSKAGKFRVAGYCKECSKAYTVNWEKGHQDAKYGSSRLSLAKAKDEAYRRYGDKCVCCGETDRGFFTIGHVNDDGGGRKRGYNIYFKVRAEGYPDTYAIECYNCNLGKARNGGICPHRANKLEVVA